MSKISVYVIFHSLNDSDKLEDNDPYIPLFVGRNGKNNHGYCSDDTGDNISFKNPNYCELTGLYWMCKNSTSNIVGLVHYRRYLAKNQFGKILDKNDIEKFLKNYDLIIPKGTKRLDGNNYESFTSDAKFKSLLDDAKEYIFINSPEYIESWNKVMNSYTCSFFNMFIGSKELMNDYCNWLFPILDFLFEEKWDERYNDRWLGFLSEILFNVWITYNNLKVKEVPIKSVGFKLKIKTFFINLTIVRALYKYIYHPLFKNKQY